MISYWNCYIVFESDGFLNRNCYKEAYGVDLSMIDFAKALYSDINNNLEAWVDWDVSSLEMAAEEKYDEYPGTEFIEEEYQTILEEVRRKRRKVFTDRLQELKMLIEENEKHFGPNRFFL